MSSMRRRRAHNNSSQSPQELASNTSQEVENPTSSSTLVNNKGHETTCESSTFDSHPKPQQQNDDPTKTTTTNSRIGGGGDDDDSLIMTQRRPIMCCSTYCTYYTAKWAILRLLAAVYLTAFLGAWYQNEGLMGHHGIVPAEQYWNDHVVLQQHRQNQDSYMQPRWKGFMDHPTLFWWIPLSDFNMRWFIIAPGIIISWIVLFLGVNSWLLQLLLWILDFSIVTLANGTSFYAYGWESQLLETGFLAIFLCNVPVYDWRCRKFHLHLWEKNLFNHNSKDTNGNDDVDVDEEEPPSEIILWLFCWLIFRISLVAGLIKIRGSSCWALKTCLHYHFETQPIPSPLSFFFHFLPNVIRTKMVDVDLWVQLYTSWIVLLPTNCIISSDYYGSWSFPWPRRRNSPIALMQDDSSPPTDAAAATNTTFTTTRTLITERLVLCCRWLVRLGGWVQAGFMVGIIASGNFAFLNHLTIIPALACLDDTCWPSFMNRRPRSLAFIHTSSRRQRSRWIVLDWILLGYIMYLSWPVVANLLQLEGRGRQVMNMSFGKFRLVNTYGAFGDVSKARYEPIVSIHGGSATDDWVELEFPCKPGSLTRRPCFSAPYHYRLDWNIWFLGFKPHLAYLQQREQWMYSFLKKVLEPPNKNAASKDDQPWLDLLDRSTAEYLKSVYYSKGTAPRYAKVDMYYYGMAAPLWEIMADIFRTGQAQWWKRAFEEHLILPVEVRQNRLQFAQIEEQYK